MNPIPIEAGRLTIGVAAHGNVGVTIECLNSIFASVCGNFDLILVDDASPDDMIGLFRETRQFHPRTRVFAFPENKEYSHSVNCILAHARTEFTLFVSNDIFITAAYVSELLAVMADDAIGIARGVSNFVDGFIGSAIHNVEIADEIASYEQVVALAETVRGSARARTTPDLFLTGDAFIVRRDLLRRIGGYDTGFVGYLSDMDFGVRAAHAGYGRVVCGRAFAWHAQDANITYLPDAERDQKRLRRAVRVASAWKVFRGKWSLAGLPHGWQPTMLRMIPYLELDARAFDPATDRASGQDYSAFELA